MWKRVWSTSATFASMILAVVAQASSMVVNKMAMLGGTNNRQMNFETPTLPTRTRNDYDRNLLPLPQSEKL
ncbi:hypothetical protein CDL15_Pgr028242 [Punica granatum]|uniref:Uncharacterized protein n=1 Tax=Punica granatum TaxID=22663 RepID=A0A218WWI2_PUNGR|nr:hypothetical protein CDL15_Pgr028242 [Punica granatum]